MTQKKVVIRYREDGELLSFENVLTFEECRELAPFYHLQYPYYCRTFENELFVKVSLSKLLVIRIGEKEMTEEIIDAMKIASETFSMMKKNGIIEITI
jgi:hypothetical protein